jgi:2-dehydropantoate 2-reductase
MKTAIIGPGALGTLLATSLARAKNEVWLLDNNPQRAKKLSHDNIKLEGVSGSYKAKINITADTKEIGTPETIFICVKSYDTENALKHIKHLVGDNTYVVSLQGGLGNLQLISEYVESERIIGGITSQGATLVEEGHVQHTAKGETIIGQDSGKVLSGIREISSMLGKASFPTKVSKDINSVIWSRLIINVGINALSAVTRLKNGSLVKNEYTREIMRRAVSEAAKVAKRKRIKLLYDDPIQKVESVCRATTGNLSSMLQDVLNQRQTEIDFINGSIIRQAKNLNIKTPTNEMLTELVKGIEENYNNLVTQTQG